MKIIKKIIYYIFVFLFLLSLDVIGFPFGLFFGISFAIFIVILILLKIRKYFEEKKKQEEEKEAEKKRQEIERWQQEAWIKEQREYEKALKNAKNAYEQALDGTDKRDAYKKGKAYYALKRNGISALSKDYTENLSRRDEERIKSDILSMNLRRR